jgi:hypothetical protein
MRSALLQPRLPRLLLLGTVELGLLPLRLAARILGGLLLLLAAVGVPAWLIQLVISLLGGGSGGGPAPAWAMVPLLAVAFPAGVLALHAASVPGPLTSAKREHATINDDETAQDSDEPDPDTESEPESDRSTAREYGQPLAWAYQALELDQDASLADVKAAYRRLAHVYHPDHNPGFTKRAAERFDAVNQAYDALLHRRATKQPAYGL